MIENIRSTGRTTAAGLVFATAVLLAPGADADSMRSQCGFSGSQQERPQTTSACTFSQRQGFISVSIDGGQAFEFSPLGDTPGNYLDQNGKAIFRQAGLGDKGQLFKLPDTFLYVFWSGLRVDCPREELTAPRHCELGDGAISFLLQASAEGSLNTLRITPRGLSIDNRELQEELDGTAYRAELADLDANGWPEIYVYASSAGSGSYGSVVAYAVNNGKSVSPIHLPPMEQSPEAATGYMGHDEFAVVENRLVRRFPLYLQGDTNAAASGGTRQLQYRLEAGEAGWILKLDRVVDY